MSSRTLTGLGLAMVSAATFGTSGALARGLLESGWSPAAAVTWRVAIGGLALLLPSLWLMRGRWHLMRRGWITMALFGLLAVAACQLAYFLAVERISVAVALLLEYLGIILVVGWLWLRHGQRPRPLTVLGSGLAICGLVLVLNVFGAVEVDLLGVLFGLLAAVGLAAYFLLSADESTGLPPLVLATGGLLIGAAALSLAGLVGLLPMRTSTVNVDLAGAAVPWWVAMACLGVVAAAIAYATGVAATRRLGSKVASFVGLTEVLFSFVWAWLLVSELPAVIQLLGSLLILAGVIVVKFDERPGDLHPAGPVLPPADPAQTRDADRVEARDAEPVETTDSTPVETQTTTDNARV